LKVTKTIAIFDLDKTLIPFDCDEQWGRYLYQRGLTSSDFLRQQAAFFEQYDAGKLDIHAYQAFAIDPVIQMGKDRATQELGGFVDSVVKPSVHDSVQSLIRNHRDQGHLTLVITATNHFVSAPVAELFGVDDVIAIDLELDCNTGWFNGKIAGVPSFREGKVQRFQAWLRSKQLCLTELKTFFYSDSLNDMTLLEFVDIPVATNPSDAFRRIALNNNWDILDLFSAQK
jgi:HAD superfamily hydrolase (TIGR01490 family)